MNCEEARRHWSLYHDSEGDAETCFEISEHLADCAACAQWFHRQSYLEDKIKDKLRSDALREPSPELWSKVLVGSGVERPATNVRRWTTLGTVLALAASLLAIVSLRGLAPHDLNGPSSKEMNDLTKLSAVHHTQFASLGQPVEYESQSDLDVENYLRQRVNFSVRCPPRHDSGFFVRGAGICRLAESEAAYLVGQVGGSDVSIFILPKNALASFPQQQQELADGTAHRCREGNYQMMMATIDQSVVLVIGTADEEGLRKVLAAYGSYHEHA